MDERNELWFQMHSKILLARRTCSCVKCSETCKSQLFFVSCAMFAQAFLNFFKSFSNVSFFLFQYFFICSYFIMMKSNFFIDLKV